MPQSYGMWLVKGSSRVLRDGSWGWVQQFATMAQGALMPLNPFQIPGRNDHERVVVPADERLEEVASRRRVLPVVV